MNFIGRKGQLEDLASILRKKTSSIVACRGRRRIGKSTLLRKAGVSFGYGRIFYVYGRNEDSRRLCGSIVDHLRRGERVTVSGGHLVRDYMYAKDIAAAFAKFVDTSVEGAINIGTGTGTTIDELARTLAEALGRPEFVDYRPNPGNQPPRIVADVTRLREEVGFCLRYSVTTAVADLTRQ